VFLFILFVLVCSLQKNSNVTRYLRTTWRLPAISNSMILAQQHMVLPHLPIWQVCVLRCVKSVLLSFQFQVFVVYFVAILHDSSEVIRSLIGPHCCHGLQSTEDFFSVVCILWNRTCLVNVGNGMYGKRWWFSDLQHYPFQEPGTRLWLPGYPDPVSTLKQGRKTDNEVTCSHLITQFFSVS